MEASTGQWEGHRIEPLLQKRGGHTAVTLKEHVYVIGGSRSPYSYIYQTIPLITTEILPANSRTWEQGPPLPVEMPIGPCAIATSDTTFLVFYGKDIREFDASIAGPTSSKGWVKEDKWPKLEISRKWGPGCARVGEDKVVIAGGWNDERITVQSSEILNVNTRKISKGGKMATRRSAFHIISFKFNSDFITLAVGGMDNDLGYLNSVEKWNATTESWSTVKTRLNDRKGWFGAVAAPKSLICP